MRPVDGTQYIKVYTVTVPNIQTATLFPIIREQVKPDSIVYTDCYRSYDVLDVSKFSHFSFAETSFSYQSQHTFCWTTKPYQWNWELLEPSKPKEHFELYLKECE